MIDNVKSIEEGRNITLGKVHKEITLPDGSVMEIKRMGMKSEQLFLSMYNDFVKQIEKSKVEINDKIKGFIGGASTASFDISAGLQIVGDILGSIPALQTLLIDAVQVIFKARQINISNEKVMDTFGTADVITIIMAQGEAQGLLTLFRSLIERLATTRR